MDLNFTTLPCSALPILVIGCSGGADILFISNVSGSASRRGGRSAPLPSPSLLVFSLQKPCDGNFSTVQVVKIPKFIKCFCAQVAETARTAAGILQKERFATNRELTLMKRLSAEFAQVFPMDITRATVPYLTSQVQCRINRLPRGF